MVERGIVSQAIGDLFSTFEGAVVNSRGREAVEWIDQNKLGAKRPTVNAGILGLLLWANLIHALTCVAIIFRPFGPG